MPTTTLKQMVEQEILTPRQAKDEIPISEYAKQTISTARRDIQKILNREDSRFIIITGPCSIHDPEEALEYSQRLKQLSEQVNDKILLIMRVYVEKPRTKLGWKGLINDPNQDESYNIQKGILTSRKLFNQINELGIPIATEFLTPHSHKYLGDLVSWAAIGARTTETPFYAEFVSGLEIPVGFKNTTGGNIKIAVNSIAKANSPHVYLDTSGQGNYIKIQTRGNPYSHLVLRGGKQPNFSKESIKSATELLKAENLPANIIIDCSHGNSEKNPSKQPEVLKNITQQRQSNPNILGIMLESSLNGESKTDPCINWETTEQIIRQAYQILNTSQTLQ